MDNKPDVMEMETINNHVDENHIASVNVSETQTPDDYYQASTRTYLVVAIMGITWGTCTMANIGPSTTYSYAVKDLGGSTASAWIPNAALFPLIGIQPLWVSASHRSGKVNS